MLDGVCWGCLVFTDPSLRPRAVGQDGSPHLGVTASGPSSVLLEGAPENPAVLSVPMLRSFHVGP